MSRTKHPRKPKHPHVGCRCTYCEFRKAPRPYRKLQPIARPHDAATSFDVVENFISGHLEER